MSNRNDIVFFVYKHAEQAFTPSQAQTVLAKILETKDIEKLEKDLTTRNIDALLVWDARKQKWYLVFGSHTGIVAQRTARRQADTMIRTGYRGKIARIPGGFPLEELSRANIGDLWKTAQMKYSKSDLKGAAVIPPKEQVYLREEQYMDENPPTHQTMSLEDLGAMGTIQKMANEDKKTEETKAIEKQEARALEKSMPLEGEKAEFEEYVVQEVQQLVRGGSTRVIAKAKSQDSERLLVFKPSEIDDYVFMKRVIFLKPGERIKILGQEKDGVVFVLQIR